MMAIIRHRALLFPRHRKAVSKPAHANAESSMKWENFPIRCMRVCECVDKARQGAMYMSVGLDGNGSGRQEQGM